MVGPKGHTKVQIGTPHYMAPEVWRREPYSFPADIWSLGCILHELCTRKPLFLADTEEAIESRVGGGGRVVLPRLPARTGVRSSFAAAVHLVVGCAGVACRSVQRSLVPCLRLEAAVRTRARCR